MKPMLSGCALALVLAFSAPAFAVETSVTVGGAAMTSSRTIARNLLESKDHTTFVEALHVAGLDERLAGPGPYLVFAPTNAAFDALPKGLVDELLMPENRQQLIIVLSSHILPLEISTPALVKNIRDAGGTYGIKNINGTMLNLAFKDEYLTVADETGTTARVLIPDVPQSNGAVYVIDQVIAPQTGFDAPKAKSLTK